MIANNIIYNIITSALIQGLGVLSLIVIDLTLAKHLKTQLFGVYSTVSSWLTLAVLISTFGLNTLLVKLIANYHKNQDTISIKQLILFSKHLTIFVSIMLIAVLATGLILNNINNFYTTSAIVAFAGLPLISLLQQNQSSLRGINKFNQGLIPEFTIKPLTSLIFIYFIIHNNALSLDLALASILLSTLIAYCYSEYLIKKNIGYLIYDKRDQAKVKYWLNNTFPLLVINLLSFLSIKLDILMLGFYVSDHNVGVFSASSKISESMVFLLVASNSFITPMISKMLNNPTEKEALSELIKKNSFIIFLINLPLVLILIIFGKLLLNMLDSTYVSGYPILLVLILGQLSSSFAGPVGNILIIGGYEKTVIKIMVFSATLNICLNLILIQFYGMFGAALSTSISIITINAIFYNHVKRKLGINTLFYTRKK